MRALRYRRVYLPPDAVAAEEVPLRALHKAIEWDTIAATTALYQLMVALSKRVTRTFVRFCGSSNPAGLLILPYRGKADREDGICRPEDFG
jgi:hypothetical protein